MFQIQQPAGQGFLAKAVEARMTRVTDSARAQAASDAGAAGLSLDASPAASDARCGVCDLG